MNAEILERLLIDRALGQLSPDVEILLQQHLAADPTAAHAAKELADVVELATHAIRPATAPSQLPPLIEPVFSRPFSKVLALAASFILGGIAVFMGMRLAPSNSHELAASSGSTLPAAETGPRPSANAVRITRRLPFWSNQRALLLAADAQSQTNPSPR